MNRSTGIALGLSALVLGVVAAQHQAATAPSPGTSGGGGTPRPPVPTTARRAYAAHANVAIRQTPAENAPIVGTLGQGSGILVGPDNVGVGDFLPIVREWVNEDGSRTARNLGWVTKADITFADPGSGQVVTGPQSPVPYNPVGKRYASSPPVRDQASEGEPLKVGDVVVIPVSALVNRAGRLASTPTVIIAIEIGEMVPSTDIPGAFETKPILLPDAAELVHIALATVEPSADGLLTGLVLGFEGACPEGVICGGGQSDRAYTATPPALIALSPTLSLATRIERPRRWDDPRAPTYDPGDRITADLSKVNEPFQVETADSAPLDPRVTSGPQTFVVIRSGQAHQPAGAVVYTARHEGSGQIVIGLPEDVIVRSPGTGNRRATWRNTWSGWGSEDIAKEMTPWQTEQPRTGAVDAGECDTLFNFGGWPSQVDDFKAQLDHVFDDTDATVKNCAGFPQIQRNSWAAFLAEWKTFRAKPTDTFGSYGEWKRACTYAKQLDAWRVDVVAKANCTFVGPTTVHGYEVPVSAQETLGSIASVVKWGAIGLGGTLLFITLWPEIRALGSRRR